MLIKVRGGSCGEQLLKGGRTERVLRKKPEREGVYPGGHFLPMREDSIPPPCVSQRESLGAVFRGEKMVTSRGLVQEGDKMDAGQYWFSASETSLVGKRRG